MTNVNAHQYILRHAIQIRWFYAKWHDEDIIKYQENQKKRIVYAQEAATHR